MQYILYTLALVVLSFNFFPFEFTFMPGMNTKMAMAGIGLAVLAELEKRGLQLLFVVAKARWMIYTRLPV